MNKLLEIKNLSLTRNDYCIFSNINLGIQEGQLINIYGKNGSGKTSLLKILAGITECTDGEMIYHNSFDGSLKRTYVGHKYGVKNNLTAYENLYYSLDTHKDKQTILDALETYKMIDYKDSLIKHLSHGQQKRVSLMKIIMNYAHLYLIDEPYSSLDEDGIKIFNETTYGLLSSGASVVITNHTEVNNIFTNTINYKI
tara:strand:+ start:18 stop:611 length:594 start_codon:yes stop_codon:yes gene_type:complete